MNRPNPIGYFAILSILCILCQLAHALTQGSECLALDELTNHLDIKYQLQIMDIVKSLVMYISKVFGSWIGIIGKSFLIETKAQVSLLYIVLLQI